MFSKFYRFKLLSESTIKIESTCILSFFLKLREWNTDKLISFRKGNNTTLQLIITLPSGDYKIEVGTTEEKPNYFPSANLIEWVPNSAFTLSNDNRTCKIYAPGSTRSIFSTPPIVEKTYLEVEPGYWPQYGGYLTWYIGLKWGDPAIGGTSNSNATHVDWCYWYYSEYWTGDTSRYYRNGSYVSAPTVWDMHTIRIAVDPFTGKVWFGRHTNGSYVYWNEGGNPTTGTTPSLTVTNGHQVCYLTGFIPDSSDVPWTISREIPKSRVPDDFITTYATSPGLAPDDPFSLKYEVIG